MSATERKRTDHLHVGDVVRYNDVIRTVTHTQDCGGGHVLVVFDDATTNQWPADKVWTLASEAEIAAASATAKRLDMARALTYMADLVRDHDVAPTVYSINLRASTRTIADLQTWATVLDCPIKPGGTSNTIPVIHCDGLVRFGDVRLDVHVQAMEDLPTADDQPDMSSPVLVAVDEVYALLSDDTTPARV